ncbi:MAG: PepSY domain-containing protein [Rhodocyclaceae bacterium]
MSASGKRWLYLAHRWLGIALCLFFALWFLSGVVMMYVGYPKLTVEERLQGGAALTTATCCAAPTDLLAALPHDAALKSLRLGSVAGQPRLLAVQGKRAFAVDAASGTAVTTHEKVGAGRTAAAFAPTATIGPVEQIAEDAWTHSKALDMHRPMFRVTVTHPEWTALYVSGTTGEVVRDVTHTESRWNWIGAWLHWLYPLRGGSLDPWWTDIVIGLSLAGCVLVVIGMVVGLLRWRARGYAHGSRSPYRSVVKRWHHVIGLFSGLLILAWIASGLFSVNPWKMFDSGAKNPVERLLEAPLLARQFDPAATLSCFAGTDFVPYELEWLRHGDQLHGIGRSATNQTRVLRDVASCRITADYTSDELHAEAARLMPQARLIESVLQKEYDWHYYARAPHTMTGGSDKPLPILRLMFDDPHGTWLYLDPRTSRIVQRIDDHARVKRWLFNFLHGWDWLLLLDHRPLWDALLILGSIAGFLASLTAAALGWKRLWR